MVLRVGRDRLAPPFGPRGRLPKVESVVLHLVGIALLVTGAGMLVSSAVELTTTGQATGALAGPGAGFVGIGTVLWRLSAVPGRLPRASIYASILAAWVVVSVAGALPFVVSGALPRFDDALFETISGFTTTGSTVLRPIEGTAAGILFWRSMTQWIGGIGIVVVAVSVLPFLGIGGLELLSAETPGPAAERLVPRVRETAKRLVSFYLGFSVIVAVLYAAFGMTPYLAVTHMFTTVSTGGFSPLNASLGHFDSAGISWVTTASMFTAGGSYALYWQAIRGRPLRLFRSTEMHAYAALTVGIVGLAVAFNVAQDGLTHRLVRDTALSVVAITSTTGYGVLDYDQWSTAVRLWLLFAMVLGGMAGSTTGGLKVFRLLTVMSYARRQVFLQLHPRAVLVVRFGREAIPEQIVTSVLGFFGLFLAIGALGTFFIGLSGADLVTSISAAAQALGNVGPGMGQVGPSTDFLNLHPTARGVLMVIMLFGRLEIMPVLLGVVPLFRVVSKRVPRKIVQRLTRVASG